MQAVHAAGGITVVQQPGEARMPQMPQAALDRIAVDYVLTLEEIVNLFEALPRTVHA